MKPIKVDAEYGRFQGVQFDLPRELEYGQEVTLSVHCRVVEQTVRSNSAGDARRIHVLKPLEIANKLQSPKVHDTHKRLDLGDPVALADLDARLQLDEEENYFAEANQFEEPHVDDIPEPDEEQEIIPERIGHIVDTQRAMRVPFRTRDKMLAGFLAGE
jgi:hypothetical protein